MVGILAAGGVQFSAGQPLYDHVLTNFFKPVMADARNNATPTWAAIKKGIAKMDTAGRYIIQPVRTSRNRGRNAVREGGEIPDPGRQGFKTYAFESRTYMARIKIDGATLDRADTDGGAFADAVVLEMEGQVDDITVDFGRMIHNDGSGRLAEYASNVTTTMTIRLNQSIPGASTCPTRPVLYLEQGDLVGMYIPSTDSFRTHSGGTATLNNGFFVRTILSSNSIELSLTEDLASAMTISEIGGLTAGDWIVRMSNEKVASAKSSGARAEMIGLQGIISQDGALDGNTAATAQQSAGVGFGSNPLTQTTVTGWYFQGILATSANPFNRAIVSSLGTGATRPLDETLMQSALSDFEEQNNGVCGMYIMPYATFNDFCIDARGDKRYVNTLELKTGLSTITFNDIPIMKDRFCYGGRAIGIDLEEFMNHEVAPLGPMAPFGIPRWERLNDTEAYWTGMRARANLGVNVRQRCGFQIVDLSN